MDFRMIAQFKRQLATDLGRRSALLAASGLAALPLVAVAQADDDHSAARADDDLSAAHRRVRRGRRGPRGERGRRGKAAGAALTVVTQVCDVTSGTRGTFEVCTAACDAGFAATGGGFTQGNLFTTGAIIRGSRPDIDGTTPTGWEIEIEYIQPGQFIQYNAFAICAPTGNSNN